MKINGIPTRSISLSPDGWSVRILDQRKLPHEVMWVELKTVEEAATAIAEMWTRGAPLLSLTAAYGMCLALRKDASDASLSHAYETLLATRPTAVNLRWALDQMREAVAPVPVELRASAAYERADALCEEDIALNRAIGEHGLKLLKEIAEKKPKGEPLNILTHCNAGWIATVDYGTALAPIYLAHDASIPVHVWVDETRPRNQGALTAWELAQHGVSHTVIVDNAGGLLMRQGRVDLCIVGADRVTKSGDVCNKIGTYLKALAAKDNGVPFYVAVPYTTFDHTIDNGDAIPIEQREAKEVLEIGGHALYAPGTPVVNPAFDVTPARLVTGYITERGIQPGAA
ncbi:MAG: S-methyl-5-thioribose-1-phosphate isomerase [Alphaproteobacteria bacterium]|nr:S-methyl-5-thioribose-1-phosphate isomerase [Alphaproteobacteria bacterium]